MMIMTGHTLMMMMSGLFVRNRHPSQYIPTMLAPRIERTAVHMPGLFRKLCERSFGTMEEDEEEGKVLLRLGQVGSYWTAEDRLAREGTKKPSGCGCVTFMYIRRCVMWKLTKWLRIITAEDSFFSYILKSCRRRPEPFSWSIILFFSGGRAERRQFPFCRLCVATSKFSMRVNIYAIAYSSGVSYYIIFSRGRFWSETLFRYWKPD